MLVAYRGGTISRAGTKFIDFSKQTGRLFPPRMITFQFSINQGLALEFGHQYMRVVSDGAFVTEPPVAIGGASQADPAVLTFGAQGATAATPINTGVTFSYAPGDLISLLGGTALNEAVLAVTTSQLVSILANARGTGYTVADTITLGGGVFSAAAVVTVASVVGVAATGNIAFTANPSDGDTVTLNGVTWTFKTALSGANQTIIQGTLAGTLVQLAADLNASGSGSLTPATYGSTTSLLTVVYDTTGAGGNAYTLAASVGVPSAATLTGGTTTGLGTVTVTTPGVYTALPPTGDMTQSASSGGGTGASLQTAVFGPHAVTISSPGAYSVVPANPVAQDTTTGIGLGATFTMTWAATPAFANDDWIEISGVVGMTELNGNTYVVHAATATTVQLYDVYGDPVDATAFGAYISGGIVSRIFTLATPYDEEDLPWLKVTQSADEMTICCVNQDTEVEYAPLNLIRHSDSNWSFSGVVAVPSVSPPATCTATISDSGSTFYQYVVTAVSPVDGTESVASPIASVKGVQISTEAGQVNITWAPVAGVQVYNVYKAQPSYGSAIPVGSLFGFIGSAYGTGFQDTNILPDFSQVPPKHKDPFARGQLAGINIVSGGSGYTTATAVITTSTGSGAVTEVIIQGGHIVGVIIDDAGHDYTVGDTVAFTGAGGVGATGTLLVGAEVGTYPSVPGYFQQRRVYANTENAPDTYFMSQPGAFDNFDSRIPPIATDALAGSPWAIQVDGIQFLVQTAGGLLIMTGQTAWILVGAGSFATNAQPISPSSQDANPQAFTGCSPKVPPIKINYDILYVTAKGSFYYDLPYQLYALSEPIDLTQYSTHLFVGHTVIEHAWTEQPYKVLWSVRDDGVMLSDTFLKAEQLNGWARHDTDGLFCSVCSVTEPPVDALYMATKRFPGNKTAYMIERMDDRIWASVEDCWCVDSALQLPQPTPNATLTADLPYGIGNLTGVTDLIGGSGYSAGTTATIDDENEGPGTGAVPVLTIVAGVITAVNFAPQGSGYLNPKISVVDPANTGTDFSARVTLNSTATFTASGAVFAPGDVGDVIRMGGGIATITAYINTQNVSALVTTPITDFISNSGLAGETPRIRPQPPGAWTQTTPITTVSGLGHLAGAMVTGLADGNVIEPQQVSPAGSITLSDPASSIVIGLGFQAQMQSVYLEAGAPTSQGQRKKVAAASVLVEASRGGQMGSNQIDGSTLNPPKNAPLWLDMDDIDEAENIPEAAYNSDVAPLYTGYFRIPVTSGFQTPGQVALQQSLPLPLNVLSLAVEYLAGDTPEQAARPRQGRGQ